MTIARSTYTDGNGVSHVNDIYLDPSTGSLATVSGKEEYAQILEAATKTQKGELQLDVENGIDYFNTIFENRRWIRLWKNDVVNRILSFDFVDSVRDFVYDIIESSRTVRYMATIKTVDDTTVTIES